MECPECKGRISEYAESCPHCGCPMNVIKRLIAEKQKTVAPDSSVRKEITIVDDEQVPVYSKKNDAHHKEMHNTSTKNTNDGKDGTFQSKKDDFNEMLLYGTTLHIMKNALAEGIINTDEYLKAEKILQEKYKNPYAHFRFEMTREELDEIAGKNKK